MMVGAGNLELLASGLSICQALNRAQPPSLQLSQVRKHGESGFWALYATESIKNGKTGHICLWCMLSFFKPLT